MPLFPLDVVLLAPPKDSPAELYAELQAIPDTLSLCGLIQKIDQTVRVFPMEKPEDLETIVKEVAGC